MGIPKEPTHWKSKSNVDFLRQVKTLKKKTNPKNKNIKGLWGGRRSNSNRLFNISWCLSFNGNSPPLLCWLSLKSISALGPSNGAVVKIDGAQSRRWRKRQGRGGFILYSSHLKVIYLILTSHLVCSIRTENCHVDSNLWLYLQEDLHCKPTHFRLKIHYIAISTEFQAGWNLIWNLWNKGLLP